MRPMIMKQITYFTSVREEILAPCTEDRKTDE
jgi:hypothetical protein